MELRSISNDDLALYERIHCDPQMMAELGGAFPPERIPVILDNVLDFVQSGRGWVYKLVPDPAAGRAAGTVCIWENEWQGTRINEIGWMVLPEFQGQGLASQAVRTVLNMARTGRRWDVIHAFPSTSNMASNQICRKAGFSQLESCNLDFAERILHCNHWRLDLQAPGPHAG